MHQRVSDSVRWVLVAIGFGSVPVWSLVSGWPITALYSCLFPDKSYELSTNFQHSRHSRIALFHHSLQSIFRNPYSKRLYARISVSGFVLGIKVQIPNNWHLAPFSITHTASQRQKCLNLGCEPTAGIVWYLEVAKGRAKMETKFEAPSEQSQTNQAKSCFPTISKPNERENRQSKTLQANGKHPWGWLDQSDVNQTDA